MSIEMNPFPRASTEEIHISFGPELDTLAAIFELSDALGQRLSGLEMEGMDRFHFFVLFQFVKASKTAQAIYCLFSTGFAEDAEMLSRVLVEQSILVRWVHKEDSDQRVKAFALYLREGQFRLLEQMRRSMPDFDLGGVPVDDIEGGHLQYLALEKSDKWRALTGAIAGIAADVGMNVSYLLHMGGSDLIHSNPTREASYVRDSDDGTYFNATASIPGSGLVPVVAAQHLLFVLDVLNEVFELRADNELRRLMDRVHNCRPAGG